MEASDKSPYADFATERARVTQMPGWKAVATLDMIRRIGLILQGNIAEFQAHLDQMSDPGAALALWSVNNREAFEQFLDESERLAHNALAAVNSRVDLMRNLVRDLGSEDKEFLNGKYQERINSEFATNVRHRFLIDLRNYTLHYRLPVVQSSLEFGPDRAKHAMHLDAAALLNWDGWKTISRTWLAGKRDNVNLGNEFQHYAAAVARFDSWLASTYQEQNSEIIQEYRSANQELERKMK